MKHLKTLILIAGAASILVIASGCGSSTAGDDAGTNVAVPSNDKSIQKGTTEPMKPNTN